MRMLETILVLMCSISMVAGLDVDPPPVPNPWNTSEARALRDHLAETYGVRVDPHTDYAKLVALYKEKWIGAQRLRRERGEPVDPAYAAAVEREAADQRRREVLGGLERLGVHPDLELTTTSLEALLAQEQLRTAERDASLANGQVADAGSREGANEARARQAIAADFSGDVERANAEISAVLRGIDMTAIGYDLMVANDLLLQHFPAGVRKPAHAFVLGNMLFGIDPVVSRRLHQEAFAALGGQPEVCLEWAMELHRQGSHAEAIDAYRSFLARNPDFAPVHGLIADCLIRLGRIEDACASWTASERARQGSLEKFESMVCDIYKDASGDRLRHDLRTAGMAGDRSAVVRLLCLDADYEMDWWNRGPSEVRLRADVGLLDRFPGDASLDLVRCVVALLQCDREDRDAQRRILDRYPRILEATDRIADDQWRLYGILLQTCLDRDLRQASEFSGAYIDRLVALSSRVHDADLCNLVARLWVGRPTYADWVRTAWKATGDVRFANGFLLEEAGTGASVAGSTILQEALAKHPMDANLHARNMERKGGAIGRDELVAAIIAEFSKFSVSSSGVDIPRPRARRLRQYFGQLARQLRPAPR